MLKWASTTTARKRSYRARRAAWVFPGILWNSDGASSETEICTFAFVSISNKCAHDFQYGQNFRQATRKTAIQTQGREEETRSVSVGILNSKTVTFRAAIRINNEQLLTQHCEPEKDSLFTFPIGPDQDPSPPSFSLI
jgi:hypothetical protein